MKKLLTPKLFIVLIVPLIYLVVAIFTLSDYGINWDSPKHLIRGQAYLHYILTGKHNFLDIPPYPQLKGSPDSIDYNVTPPQRPQVEKNSNEMGVRRSYFQSDFYTLDYYFTKQEKVPLEAKHSHPEVNDLLSAITNYIFYQKLGILGDLESYDLFIITVTFALIMGVSLWTYKNFGLIASIVASFSLSFYPLVFSESHFNIKDPVLMSFFGLAIFSFWYGFTRKRYVFVLVSAILSGLALGTKFNILFLPFILGPWAIYYLFFHLKKEKNILNTVGGLRMVFTLMAYPAIMLGVLYILSPYLWIDPVGHFLEIVNYYREIGVGTPDEQVNFIVWGWNTYPLVWVFYTTPIPVLALSTLGFFYMTLLFIRKRNDLAFLILLWFLIPILRSIWPGANVYGGDRQFMEFVPAMAILSGIGAGFLIQNLKVKVQNYNPKFKNFIIFDLSFCILIFALLICPIIKLHPNQNVYFNELVGGLSGAKEKQIPSWGNSYGNIYLQGVNWLNIHAETNAKLALAVNYISVIPRLKLREDISLDNAYWSGPRHEGEYVMEMYYDWPLKNRYKFAYYEIFLNPVHEVKVDGVPLLKIWKNDSENLKMKDQQEVILIPNSVSIEDKQKLLISFTNEVTLTKLVINHSADNCEDQDGVGYISTSVDGRSWVREPDPLIDPESPYVTPEMDKDTFVYMFPARLVSTIIINSEKNNQCIFSNNIVKLHGIKE